MNLTIRSLLLCLCAWTVLAQENRASLGGRVTDPQQALVPGAVVTVISEETRVQRQTPTNAQGEWNMPFLIPGPYRILVRADGFKTEERKGITLQTADIKKATSGWS